MRMLILIFILVSPISGCSLQRQVAVPAEDISSHLIDIGKTFKNAPHRNRFETGCRVRDEMREQVLVAKRSGHAFTKAQVIELFGAPDLMLAMPDGLMAYDIGPVERIAFVIEKGFLSRVGYGSTERSPSNEGALEIDSGREVKDQALSPMRTGTNHGLLPHNH